MTDFRISCATAYVADERREAAPEVGVEGGIENPRFDTRIFDHISKKLKEQEDT